MTPAAKKYILDPLGFPKKEISQILAKEQQGSPSSVAEGGAMTSQPSSAPEGWCWIGAGSDCHGEQGWECSRREGGGQGAQESCSGRKMRPSKGKGE